MKSNAESEQYSLTDTSIDTLSEDEPFHRRAVSAPSPDWKNESKPKKKLMTIISEQRKDLAYKHIRNNENFDRSHNRNVKNHEASRKQSYFQDSTRVADDLSTVRLDLQPREIFVVRSLLAFSDSSNDNQRTVQLPTPGPITDDFLDFAVECSQISIFSSSETISRRDTLAKRLTALTGGKELPDVVGRACCSLSASAHRKMLIKEMCWMSDDFQKEKQRHGGYRRKLSKSIQSYDKTKEAREAKKEREELLALKRNALKVSKDVRLFWDKLNKVVAYKQKLNSEEMKRRAMDKHLVFLVKQTERYTNMLAAQQLDSTSNLNSCHSTDEKSHVSERESIEKISEKKNSDLWRDSTVVEGNDASMDADSEALDESRLRRQCTTVKERVAKKDRMKTNSDDGDSSVSSQMDEADDETTIAIAEKEECSNAVKEEIDALAADADVPIEDLLNQYALQQSDSEVEEAESQNRNNDDNYDSSVSSFMDEADDETTIELAEKEKCCGVLEEEIHALATDADVPIENLLDQYGLQQSESDADNIDNDDASYYSVDSQTADSKVTDDVQESPPGSALDRDAKANASSNRGNSIQLMETGKNQEESNCLNERSALQRLNAADEAARSIKVERPFILSPRVKLREYQHVGLNWLVSLHERRLNGILADEMGLGKTLQTVALLAYLATNRGIWGPHLIVVPTSCIVNWEIELKRFCPAFKVLTYYGNQPRRKELRRGWNSINKFHVIVTSYQLAVQDHNILKRRKWFYLILDEAHNIKNFKSLRWQTLLTFHSQRRLLLTGTPLQNNLMELWSLMHFLMPHVFASRKEFSYWFSEPLSNMVEGTRSVNGELVSRLHSIMRPFILRRLKKDVAKQLPAKTEHVLMCKLSRRQALLYEEFMSRSSTRAALSGGGQFMGMMNVLMQLRKVCNHPDLFEPRTTVSPYVMEPINYEPGRLLSKLDLYGGNPNFNSLDGNSNWRKVSPELIHFLWPDNSASHFSMDQCATDSLLKLKATDDLIHNRIDVKPLIRNFDKLVEKGKLTPYVETELRTMIGNAEVETLNSRKLMATVSYRRCTSVHNPMNWRTIKSVSLPSVQFPSFYEKSTYNRKIIAGSYINEPLDLLPLISSNRLRHDEMRPLLTRFTFAVPRAITTSPIFPSREWEIPKERAEAELALKEAGGLDILHTTFSRLLIAFPDSTLVQYDSGKLQGLSQLLRERKAGKHKCLIFTQMTKMLDILERFLAMQGHTYVRLDGSTNVEKRQKLMDRFNTDEKLFCFILSTRSGGLGVNLTGADTVIFFDSDWNPAMDSQAQDRAHRIGQTREVHIFRLITQSTVEENILLKARQKRHLDHLVMTEGNFNADYLSSGGLRDILGVTASSDVEGSPNAAVSAAEIEQAMESLEDADDVAAGHALKQEAENEAQEFDDSATDIAERSKEKSVNSSSNEIDPERADERLEKEISAWQESCELDPAEIEASLLPIERYGLKIKEDVDPYYSLYYRSEEQRRIEMKAHAEEEPIDIEGVERAKELEERAHIESGSLLVFSFSPDELTRLQSTYLNERAKQKATRLKRHMTGEAWVQKPDGATKILFWLNKDTNQAQWEEPTVITQQREYRLLLETRYSFLSTSLLLRVLFFLLPTERRKAGMANKHWLNHSNHHAFDLYVMPSELSTLGGEMPTLEPTNNLEEMRVSFGSLSKALTAAKSGDRIVLENGHHWEGTITIDKPVIVTCDMDQSNDFIPGLMGGATLELSGTIEWRSKGGQLAGLALRRPRPCPDIPHMLCIAEGSAVTVTNCSFNNELGSTDHAAITISSSSLSCTFQHLSVEGSAGYGLECCSMAPQFFERCSFSNCAQSSAVVHKDSKATFKDCVFETNDGKSLHTMQGSHCVLEGTEFHGTEEGAFQLEGSVEGHGNRLRGNHLLLVPQTHQNLFTQVEAAVKSEAHSKKEGSVISLYSDSESDVASAREQSQAKKPKTQATRTSVNGRVQKAKKKPPQSLKPMVRGLKPSMKSQSLTRALSASLKREPQDDDSVSSKAESPRKKFDASSKVLMEEEEKKPQGKYLKRFVDDDEEQEPILKIVIPKKKPRPSGVSSTNQNISNASNNGSGSWKSDHRKSPDRPWAVAETDSKTDEKWSVDENWNANSKEHKSGWKSPDALKAYDHRPKIKANSWSKSPPTSAQKARHKERGAPPPKRKSNPPPHPAVEATPHYLPNVSPANAPLHTPDVGHEPLNQKNEYHEPMQQEMPQWEPPPQRELPLWREQPIETPIAWLEDCHDAPPPFPWQGMTSHSYMDNQWQRPPPNPPEPWKNGGFYDGGAMRTTAGSYEDSRMWQHGQPGIVREGMIGFSEGYMDGRPGWKQETLVEPELWRQPMYQEMPAPHPLSCDYRKDAGFKPYRPTEYFQCTNSDIDLNANLYVGRRVTLLQPSMVNFDCQPPVLGHGGVENGVRQYDPGLDYPPVGNMWSDPVQPEVQAQMYAEEGAWRKFGRKRVASHRSVASFRSEPLSRQPVGRLGLHPSAHIRKPWAHSDARLRGKARDVDAGAKAGNFSTPITSMHGGHVRPTRGINAPTAASSEECTEEGEIVVSSETTFSTEKRGSAFAGEPTITYSSDLDERYLDHDYIFSSTRTSFQASSPHQNVAVTSHPLHRGDVVELDHVAKSRALAAARAGAMWMEEKQYVDEFEVPKGDPAYASASFNYEPPEEGELVPSPVPNFRLVPQPTRANDRGGRREYGKPFAYRGPAFPAPYRSYR